MNAKVSHSIFLQRPAPTSSLLPPILNQILQATRSNLDGELQQQEGELHDMAGKLEKVSGS